MTTRKSAEKSATARKTASLTRTRSKLTKRNILKQVRAETEELLRNSPEYKGTFVEGMSPREFEMKLRRLVGEQLWFENERKRLLRQFEELIHVQGERPPFRVKWQGLDVEVRRVRLSEYQLVYAEPES